MNSYLRIPLFWRNFTFILALLLFTAIGWLLSFKALSEYPYAKSIAQQISTTSHLVKYALESSDALSRDVLIRALYEKERIEIFPREPTDRIQLIADNQLNSLINELVKENLGDNVVLADRMNGDKGLFVSVRIADDQYWLKLSDAPLNPPFGTAWIGWVVGTIALSLLVSYWFTFTITTPLIDLRRFAQSLEKGEKPEALPVSNPTQEIAEVNEAFNSMAQTLRLVEQDRQLLIDGVSHDLRTPITRLRLEIELANLAEDTQKAMLDDLEQMTDIVKQFSVFSRTDKVALEPINLHATLTKALETARLTLDSSIELHTHMVPGLYVMGNGLELLRTFQNLIENAKKYGRDESGQLDLTVLLEKSPDKRHAYLAFIDQGRGVPEKDLERVVRPFERGEAARTGASGSGLGLAIVNRFVKQMDGKMELSNQTPHGLKVLISLPLTQVKKSKEKKDAEGRIS